MNNYRVRIEIDVQADSMVAAAQEGFESIKSLQAPLVEVAPWAEGSLDASNLKPFQSVDFEEVYGDA